MPDYQVLARKYRPQRFADVVGQDAIVTTLKNAIEKKRLAHAYLFCGSRGTGKTSLARLLAKALNCASPAKDGEPCNQCSSCHEISTGHSIDVLEIDGASHRGIEDVRQINETVGYAPSSGHYKIYLIDEVHMLTKEAFNALLKTLEEPPKRVIFLFATTEPHKIPATILSRCQRFNLSRIPSDKIVTKLQAITSEMGLEVEEEALNLLANLAEGGLRDAESMLDQVSAFEEKKVTYASVAEALGVFPKEVYERLESAGIDGDFSVPFDLAEQVFTSGKNITYFVHELTNHFRERLLKTISKNERCDKYVEILELLTEGQSTIKFAPSQRTALEMLLVKVLKTYRKVSLDDLITRLEQLEGRLSTQTPQPVSSISEDPTPRPEELPKVVKPKPKPKAEPKKVSAPAKTAPQKLHQSRYDTLIRFAAKELGGTLTKESSHG